jgi:hypothetical protein
MTSDGGAAGPLGSTKFGENVCVDAATANFKRGKEGQLGSDAVNSY